MHPNIKYYIRNIFLYAGLLLIACQVKPVKNVEIRGIYGHPKPLWDKGIKLTELGVNAIFVHSGSIDQDMMDKAKVEGLMVFSEFATLNGKNYVESHPEAWAINEKGEKVQAASWFMGVCPTEPQFRQYRFDQLRTLLTTYDVDGIWMDYVHWHAQFEEPKPILPETCFCDHCTNSFSKDTEIAFPDATIPIKAQWILTHHNKAWRDWRCKVIYDWTYKFKKIIKEVKPKALLGLYHCPWNDVEFDSARRKNLGLDYDMLSKTIDVFSPMVYHKRMGRKPQWVQENIQWFSDKLNKNSNTNPKVWPIVQAYNNPGIIDAKEFETVLKGGLSGVSTGVMMFTTSAVAKDEGKIAVMKKLYTQFKENPSR